VVSVTARNARDALAANGSHSVDADEWPEFYEWNGHASRVSSLALVDETLRDGLQSPSVREPDIDSRIELLHLMTELGIAAADIGLPAASSRSAEVVRILAAEIVEGRIPLAPYCAARTVLSDVAAVVEAADETGCPLEVMAFIGSSPVRMYVEGWRIRDMAAMVSSCVTFAVEHGLDACLVTEDTTRSHPEVLRLLYSVALANGARRICLADTVGYATPAGVTELVRFVRREVIEAGGFDDVEIDWHGHNDRGLGVINAIAALHAGADRLHATALGIGERCGNTSMEQLLVNLHLDGHYHGELSRLLDYAGVAARACGVAIPHNQPVVGRDAFRTATGVHAAAILKAERRGYREYAELVYSPISASLLGGSQRIDIGPLSGASNVVWWLLRHDIPVEDGLVAAVLDVAKQAERVLDDDEVAGVVERVRAVQATGVRSP
jgi:isopropylmalate/homocitrate/citramalate synthase